MIPAARSRGGNHSLVRGHRARALLRCSRWVVLRVHVGQLERADGVHLNLRHATRAGEMRHVRARGDELVDRKRGEAVSREVLAESEEKRASKDGDVLVGRVPVRRQDVAVGKAKTDREDLAGHARITLHDGELRSGWKDRRRRSPLDLIVVGHLVARAGRMALGGRSGLRPLRRDPTRFVIRTRKGQRGEQSGAEAPALQHVCTSKRLVSTSGALRCPPLAATRREAHRCGRR